MAYQKNGQIYPKQADIPFYKKQTWVVLEHCGHIDATSFKEYLGIGAYRALEKALFEDPDTIITAIAESDCIGCGQCAAVCPTGAIVVKNDCDKVWRELHDKNSKVIVQIAPAVRVAACQPSILASANPKDST